MKPSKASRLRGPICPPPDEAARTARGLELGKLEKRIGEDQGMALRRANATGWGGRMAEQRAYWSQRFWLFLVHKEAT
jgi:hypothetical protein